MGWVPIHTDLGLFSDTSTFVGYCLGIWRCVSFCFPPGISGIAGEIDDDTQSYYIWTHKKFSIGYNGNQIVDVNLTSEGKVKLAAGEKLSFSYEVNKNHFLDQRTEKTEYFKLH